VIGIVDYAHTPDALEKVLKTIQAIRTGNEQIITVIGCGGDRDKGKRPMMAKVAGELSDRLILTSDNPRSEDPSQIIEEMRPGVPPNKATKSLAIVDRREAIRTAVALAKRGDIILLAGKGHEKYQEIKGTKHPFDDKVILTQTLEEAHR
jgi:UDP-N-acetylmuramoyl-L-alanyl-D-glutamate--2,6-diaminopimelate ligase